MSIAETDDSSVERQVWRDRSSASLPEPPNEILLRVEL
jgi:hypothetical protein